jgi:hypothetical protein
MDKRQPHDSPSESSQRIYNKKKLMNIQQKKLTNIYNRLYGLQNKSEYGSYLPIGNRTTDIQIDTPTSVWKKDMKAVVTKSRASRPWRDFAFHYRATPSQQHSAATIATLRDLSCLHSLGVFCSCYNALRFCRDPETWSLVTATIVSNAFWWGWKQISEFCW